MFDSSVLDIAIGMIFIFMIVSFGVSAGNELLSSLFKWRATLLASSVRGLLGGQEDETARALTRKIYEHPLIRGLHRDHDDTNDRRKPSSLPPGLFAAALLDIALVPQGDARGSVPKTLVEARNAVAGNRSVLGNQVTDVLLAFLDRAEQLHGDESFQRQALESDVEGWFKDAMERVGGWYKRRTQFVGFIVGLVIVSFTNVDSIRCARVLANNQVLRASLIAEATRAGAAFSPASTAAGAAPPATPPPAAAPSPATPPAAASGAPSAAPAAGAAHFAPSPGAPVASPGADSLQERRKSFKDLEAGIGEISDLGIPMGWPSESNIPFPSTGKAVLWWLYKICGLLLTAVAASFGAPFWFAMLQRAIPARKDTEVEATPK